jgi:hypothetical protein
MTDHYLISFPSDAMDLAGVTIEDVGEAARGVVREIKAAGAWVFGGGIDDSVPPVRVAADGTVAPGTYEQTARLDGGYTVIRVETRAEAEMWAARLARACRCPQELRMFGYDPES